MMSNDSLVASPGIPATLPIVLMDDLNSPITAPQILTLTMADDSAVRTTSRYATNYSITFMGPVDTKTKFRVETSSPTVFIYINVTLQNCPPGYNLEIDTCKCKETSYNGLVKCSSTGPTIQSGVWIGNLSDDSNDTGTYYVGYCPYLSQEISLQYSNVSAEHDMCMNAGNRTGVLCAECRTGYAPTFNDAAFSCVDAASCNWWIWLAGQYIPLTVLFIVVVLFPVNITSGPANAFIFFSQMFAMTSHSTPSDMNTSRIYFAIYNLANLNFFFQQFIPPACFSEHIQGLKFILMKYLEALYPILLLLITYALIYLYENGIQPVYCIFHPLKKCFTRVRRKINLRTSVINGFATFLILAYAKIAYVSLFVLVPTSLYSYNGTALGQKRLYYMGNVIYFSNDHIPFFIVAVIMLMVFIIFPPLILLVYPLRILGWCLELAGCSNCIGAKWSHLLDTFHGCYKNGTNGTRDSRYFAGFYLIYRLAILLCLLQPMYFVQFIIKQLVLMAIAVSFMVLRPYANDAYNSLDATIMVILVAANTLELYIDNNNFLTATETNVWAIILRDCLVFLPFLYMLLHVLYQIASVCQLSNSKLVQWIKRLVRFPRTQSSPHDDEDEFLSGIDRLESEHLLCNDRNHQVPQYGTI